MVGELWLCTWPSLLGSSSGNRVYCPHASYVADTTVPEEVIRNGYTKVLVGFRGLESLSMQGVACLDEFLLLG